MEKRELHIWCDGKIVPRFLGIPTLYKYRDAVSLINLHVLLYEGVGMTRLKIEALLVVRKANRDLSRVGTVGFFGMNVYEFTLSIHCIVLLVMIFITGESSTYRYLYNRRYFRISVYT